MIRFNINCHLNRPRPFGQNVIVSHIGGNITESAEEAIAPTEDKKSMKIIFFPEGIYLRISQDQDWELKQQLQLK
jgi:hypothetical protein